MIPTLAAILTAFILVGLIVSWTVRGAERRDIARLSPGAQLGGKPDVALGLGYGDSRRIR